LRPYACYQCANVVWLDLGGLPTLAAARRGGGSMDTRRQGARQSQGRRPAPSACGADQGRTRPSLVETLGRSVAVVVTAATLAARQGVMPLWTRECASGGKRRRTSWGASGDHAPWRCDGGRGLPPTPKVARAIVAHPGQGLPVGKHRWQGERTCAWWRKDRRHRRDDAGLTANSAAMMQISMMRLLLKRLA
jgi:hypothetical protein